MKEQFSIQINQHKIFEQEINGEKMLPLKHMCDALRIDYISQYKRAKEHKILKQLLVISPTLAADQKERDMICLPLKGVVFWILSINPNKTHDHFWVLQAKLFDAIMKHYYEKLVFELNKRLKIEQKQEEIKVIKNERWDKVRKEDDVWTTFDQSDQTVLELE